MSESEQAFAAFAEALAAHGIEAASEGAGADSPVPVLEILLHVDDEERRYTAQAVFLNDVAELAADADGAGENVYLQITCPLPFEAAAPENLSEVGGLLFMLNRLMPHPQFGLSEGEGLIYMRAVIPAATRAIPPHLVVATADMMQVFLEAFAGAIEHLAAGEVSLDDVVRTLGESGLVVPGLFSIPGDEPD